MLDIWVIYNFFVILVDLMEKRFI